MPRCLLPSLLCIVAATCCREAWAGAITPDDGKVRFEFTAKLRGGLVEGQLQTPKGGAADTTSPKRPTLDELDVNTAPSYGARLGVLWRRHRLFVDFEQIHLDGTGTLSETLISQGDTYPAGTRVRSTTFVDRGTVGYRFAFTLPLCEAGCLELAPGLGYSVFGFRYRIRGDNGQNAHRFYTDYVPHLDLGWRWRPARGGKIWFSGEIRQSVAFVLKDNRRTDLFEAFARMHYDLSRRVDVFLGVGHQHMFKKDGQPTPNRPHIDFTPFFEAGITVRF